MYKLWATIIKDIRILTRDKVGLTLMFIMPVVLAIVITAIQNSTFELVNDNKVPLLLCNKDDGEASVQLIKAIEKIGMFEIKQVTKEENENQITNRMHAKDALVAIIIPKGFSEKMVSKAKTIAAKALNSFGVQPDSAKMNTDSLSPVTLYYHPVLQQSFRSSIQGALRSALQIVENKQILKSLYFSLNEKELPETFENDIVNNQVAINEIPISRNGNRNIPTCMDYFRHVFCSDFFRQQCGKRKIEWKFYAFKNITHQLPGGFVVKTINLSYCYAGAGSHYFFYWCLAIPFDGVTGFKSSGRFVGIDTGICN
jgi:ABC-2 type transport system permease protein